MGWEEGRNYFSGKFKIASVFVEGFSQKLKDNEGEGKAQIEKFQISYELTK